MSSAIDIIHGALFKIGVHSEIKPVSSTMLNHSLEKFGGFIKSLKDRGFDKTGLVVPASTADDVSERGGCRDLIETCFAVYIAKDFQKPVSAELRQEYSLAMNQLERFYRSIEVPDARPATLRVMGQGNRSVGMKID